MFFCCPDRYTDRYFCFLYLLFVANIATGNHRRPEGASPANGNHRGKDGRHLHGGPGGLNSYFHCKMERFIEQLNRIERNTLLAAKNVLTFDDVALLTGLSKSHLYKLTSTHQIPYYKPSGKNIYFDRKEVEDWLRQNRANTEQEAQSGAAAFLAKEGL